ncbi:MAG: VCBS repeat-containing protein [Bernardetiaceae bacterium]|nr:VCBS repeat-containing protein [Bernardetiaceae bacterium]
MKARFALLLIGWLAATGTIAQPANWRHLSTEGGQLPIPWTSTQQTASQIADLNRDGLPDIILACRQVAPAVVAYVRKGASWERHVIEAEFLTVEAGGATADIDQDGDLDIVFGGDWQSNAVWWWENPHPNQDPNTPWKRFLIKNEGANQHHDQVFGEFKDKGKLQLAFWNQGAKTLYLAEVPQNPKAGPWAYRALLTGESGGQMAYPEGTAKADIDGDGREDLLAGNLWFKYNPTTDTFTPIRFGAEGGRLGVAKFKPGRYPQIVVAPGDGKGQLMLYTCHGQPDRPADWQGQDIGQREMRHSHTLEIADLNGDGHLDIFCAEMAKWSEKQTEPDNPAAEALIFYGDGQGGFRKTVFLTGFGFHEGRVADLDGDGDQDIVSKPYNWKAPRLDIWLQEKK